MENTWDIITCSETDSNAYRVLAYHEGDISNWVKKEEFKERCWGTSWSLEKKKIKTIFLSSEINSRCVIQM